jgi:hypothetical protein
MTGLQMVDGTEFVKTQNGPVILIMRPYAYYGRQRTIHSSRQIKAYKNYVNDHSMKVTGGRQCIRTNNGYVIPIDIINGLPYIKMRPNTANISGKKNPSDILSKHWDMPSVWDSLKPLLFWRWTNVDKPPRNGSKKDTVAMDSKTESAKTGSV